MNRASYRLYFISSVYALGVVFLFLYQFGTAYSFAPAVHEVEVFVQQYFGGVFAYRPLARDLVLWINEYLFGGERLYLTRALITASSLVAFNLVFIGLLRRYGIAPGLWLIAILVVDLLAGLTLSVRSNPYTLPTLLLIYGAILAIESGRLTIAVVVTFIAGLTHEVSALIPAFAVLHAVAGPGGVRGRSGWLIAICVVWAAVYIGLRILIDSDAPAGGLFHDLTMMRNIEIHAVVVVMLTAALFLGLCSRDACARLRGMGRTDLILFAALALPYGIYMFFVGLLAELRLFLPFMPMLVLVCLRVYGRDSASAERSPG